MTTNLLLIRHAETDFAGSFCGHLDPPLNPRGRHQAIELVASLASDTINAVYSSDLQRALDVATALAGSKTLSCRSSAALREIYFGQWEGLDWRSIERRDPETAARWLAGFPQIPAPGGEEFGPFEQRVLAEIAHICSNPERCIAIVTHVGVLRRLLQHLANFSAQQTWDRPFPFCSVLRLTLAADSNMWRLVS